MMTYDVCLPSEAAQDSASRPDPDSLREHLEDIERGYRLGHIGFENWAGIIAPLLRRQRGYPSSREIAAAARD